MGEVPFAWPLLIYFTAVVLLVGGMLTLSHLLGQRHQEAATGQPFESGMLPTGSARVRVPVTFFLVAIFFVVFDVEAVFLFAWSEVVRQVGWPGFAAATTFIAVLLASLLYLARTGALDVAARGRESLAPSGRS
jgi:NADH-quinone oxidoreductase subunit A